MNEQAADAVNFNNVKVIGEGPALSTGLAQQNAVAQQQRINELSSSVLGNTMNAAQQMAQLAAQQATQISQNGAMLSQAMTGRVARMIMDLSAEQAAAFDREMGASIEQKLAGIEAVLAGGQQMEKIAITTPPQTGTGGAFGSETGLSQQIALALSNLAAGQAAIMELLSRTGK